MGWGIALSSTEPCRLTRRELFDRAWSKPMTRNAIELGTTAPQLTALARRLGLPLPQAGHWMKKEVGKEPPTPEFPSDPVLDSEVHVVDPAPVPRRGSVLPRRHRQPASELLDGTPSTADHAPDAALVPASATEGRLPEHPKVSRTRRTIGRKAGADRASVGGSGHLRLLITPSLGERACRILDALATTVEARGWSIETSDNGYVVAADSEKIGFVIEEKLDRVPHEMTPREIKQKADYDRECALADRGIGYRPWREPQIPQHDHVPNGELVLKFDHDYDAGGIRRTFSDGKRQRLEDMIPSMIGSLEKWSVAIKARREDRARWQRESEEREQRHQDRERQARIEGYRIALLRRQAERVREIDGLSALIARWEEAGDAGAQFADLLDFARQYQRHLEKQIAPTDVAKRIAALKLMDDDVYIYDAGRID